jgi:hypothetical protein
MDIYDVSLHLTQLLLYYVSIIFYYHVQKKIHLSKFILTSPIDQLLFVHHYKMSQTLFRIFKTYIFYKNNNLNLKYKKKITIYFSIENKKF